MAQTYIYVSCGEGREIDVFALDTSSGDLRLAQRLATAGMAVPMRVCPEVRRLYVGMRAENALQVFAMADGSGELSPVGQAVPASAPVYVNCDPALRMAFAPSYGENNLSVFWLDDQGAPEPAPQMISDLPRAHAAVLDQSGRWLLVPTLGADAIRVYRLTDDRRVAANDPPLVATRPGSGPRHPVFSSDNRFVYCLNELDGTIDSFAFDAERGILQLVHTVNMMPPGFDGKPWTAELRLTPDNRYLYATDRRSSTIAALAVDAAHGRLTLIEHVATEEQPRGMDVDPSGRWLAASGQQSGHVSLYVIDPATGRLTLRQRVETGKEPICVEIAAI